MRRKRKYRRRRKVKLIPKHRILWIWDFPAEHCGAPVMKGAIFTPTNKPWPNLAIAFPPESKWKN